MISDLRLTFLGLLPRVTREPTDGFVSRQSSVGMNFFWRGGGGQALGSVKCLEIELN